MYVVFSVFGFLTAAGAGSTTRYPHRSAPSSMLLLLLLLLQLLLMPTSRPHFSLSSPAFADFIRLPSGFDDDVDVDVAAAAAAAVSIRLTTSTSPFTKGNNEAM